ncbi:MAG: prepilin-type N-terminal cleavage/methylation domain-containing protein [Desulfobacterales bacterium]|nr:prepilin-type N-terminal cleavage/methylation domain-containing protein [Desulfobacterales bacterium]
MEHINKIQYLTQNSAFFRTFRTFRAFRFFRVFRGSGSGSGFTLLEILVAICIFGIIMATIFGSFGYVFSSAEAVNEGMDAYEIANNCLNRMIVDLKSIYIASPPGYSKPKTGDDPNDYRIVGDTSSAGDGDFSRLRFTSYAHVPLEKSLREGIAEIVYYVQHIETEDEEYYVLSRADTLYPYERFDGDVFEEKKSDPVLCPNVKSLEFKFYDDEDTEYDSWDSESDKSKYSTPRAVKIKLEIGEIGEDSPSLLFETMVNFPVFREKIE